MKHSLNHVVVYLGAIAVLVSLFESWQSRADYVALERDMRALDRTVKAEVQNLHVEADSAHRKLDSHQEQIDTAYSIIGSSQPYSSGYNQEAHQ